MTLQTPHSRLLRQLVRFRGSKDGSAAIEFSIVAMPFFFLLFAMIEVGIAMFANEALETSTQDVARLVMTGQSQSSAVPKTTGGVTETQAQANARVATEFRNALCAKTSALFTCADLKIDIQSFSSATTVSLTNPVNCQIATGFNIGGPSDIVIVRVFYAWQTFATFINFANCDGAKRQFVSTAAFRNEPF